MPEAQRIDAETAHEHLSAGDAAMLVCGYDDPKKFEQFRLTGAVSLDDFKARERNTPRDAEIIFYCA